VLHEPPLAILVGCAVAAPILVPSARLRRWRYAVGLAALSLGVAAAWVLDAAGAPVPPTHALVRDALATAAFLIVSIRSFYEARTNSAPEPSPAHHRALSEGMPAQLQPGPEGERQGHP
jgi:hypothetical protein